MPPRKNVKRQPARTRRPASRKNQKQLSAGILFIFVPLLVVCGYLVLKSMGSPEHTKPQKASAQEQVYQQENKQEPDTLSSPPKVLSDIKPKEEPKPEVKEDTKPEVTETPKEEPEQKPEETKPAPVINTVNAVKLFMFDKGLNQENITVNDKTISIKTASQDESKSLSKALSAYLKDNGLTITGSKPLKAKDSTDEYTIEFKAEKPKTPEKKPEPVTVKSAPKPEPIKTAPKPEKKDEKPKTPVKGPEKKPEVTKTPAPQPIKFTAKMAIVIDDCGYNTDLASKLASSGYPFTFAVIPYTPYSKETARIAKSSGNVLFVHFPMQPKSYPQFDPGKGTLLLNMPDAVIASIVKANMESLGIPADGANNHTGSAFTESPEKMTQALTYIKGYTGRFLDSFTSGASKAYETCRKLGMKCGVNGTFLDNEDPGLDTDSEKVGHVRSQLLNAAKKAQNAGSIIVIGHLRKDTVASLINSIPDVEKMGVKIVPVTQLMH